MLEYLIFAVLLAILFWDLAHNETEQRKRERAHRRLLRWTREEE